MAHKSKSHRRKVYGHSVTKRNRSTANGEGRSPSQSSNSVQVEKMLTWLLPSDARFSSLKLHGNTLWTPRALASLALCWAWAENRCLTDSFTYASKWMRTLTDGQSVPTTYQGMMNALTNWTASLLPLLQQRFQQLMKRIGKDRWEIAGWVPIAFDGSRDAAPRTQSNEAAYCAPDYGRGKTARSTKDRNGRVKKRARTGKVQPPAPHIWITLMWHVGLRLPWTWRLGRSNSSERTHVMEIIKEEKFPENTLFCGDAGFVGFELWSLILQHNFHFLVRVGGNVRLLTERGHVVLKQNMTVLSWPAHALRSRDLPLRLRLVRVRIGRTDMWLLTSVTDKSQLSQTQIRELYKRRWGIEVEFRGLKQTLDKGKLRCRNSARAAVELHWSLIAMTAAELAALKEQLASQRRTTSAGCSSEVPQTPPCRSLAESVRAIRYTLSNLNEEPSCNETLSAKLKRAVVIQPKRGSKSKQARYRPPNSDHDKPLGLPKVRPMKESENIKLNSLRKEKLVL